MNPLALEVNLEALRTNIKKIKDHINDDQVKLMAITKSNAYGHGHVAIAKELEEDVACFGVGLLDEAIDLREAGIGAPILIMGPCYDYEKVTQYSLTMTVISIAHYEAMLLWAKENDKIVPFHLKVDTGMHRFGIGVEEIEDFIALYNTEFSLLEGVYSHFATTYKTQKKYVHRQKDRFDQCIKIFKEYGFDLIYHLANSENAIDYPECRYNLIRIGNALYGPCNSKHSLGLKTIARAKAKVVAIQTVRKGERVGYGLAYKAKKDMKIAVIPFGFYEGSGLYKKPLGVDFFSFMTFYLKEVYRYMFRSKTIFFKEGHPLPIIGRPNMQFTLVGLSIDSDVDIGDEIDISISPIFIKDNISRTYIGGH